MRTLLTWIALVACSAISLAAASEVFLADRSQLAERRSEELRRWLTTVDARTEPLDARRRYAFQLSQEMQAPSPWFSDGSLVPAERVATNIEELARVWLLDKVNGYFILPQGRREQYIVQQIEEMRSWNPPTGLLRGEGLNAVLPIATKARAQASARDRARIDEFLGAVTRQLVRNPLGDVFLDPRE